MPTDNSDSLLTLDLFRPDWIRLDDYFGLWAIEETRFQRMVDHVDWGNLRSHVQLAEPIKLITAEPRAELVAAEQNGESLFPRSGNLAVIPIRGTLMKQQSSMSSSTATVQARRMVRAAAADPEIAGILLSIDSPGGTVAGTQALGDDIRSAGQRKPVYAYVDDLAASAAYWLASQAEQVFTIDTGLVGSIGTYLAIEDRSKLAEALKIKVHVVKAGQFKGAGVPGTEITAEQLAKWQDEVNAMNEHFLQAVARGRKLSLDTVRGLADGRVHLGAQAQQLGLIDGLKSFDETLAALRERSAKTSPSRKPKMTTETTAPAQPTAATLAELKASCPGATSDFLMAQLEANATTEAAMKAFMVKLQGDLAAKPKDEPAKKPAAAGLAPLGNKKPTVEAEAAENDFDALVAAAIKGGVSREQAIISVARRYPEAHQAYLMQSNPGRQMQRLISEKYDLAE